MVLWGQRMDRRYKQIIERDEMTPVSELSSAFSRAPNPIYMMFAYYQSALVVEFIVESYGFEALLKILLDLGNGEISTSPSKTIQLTLKRLIRSLSFVRNNSPIAMLANGPSRS